MAYTTLKLGDWNAECQVCGFKYKASQLKKRWDNLWVCKADYEPRHPADFPKRAREDGRVTKSHHPTDIELEVPYVTIDDEGHPA